MCDVFFCGGGKKKLDLFFPAKKAVDACWEVVREWAQGTFLRQRRKVPPAHAQQVFLPDAIRHVIRVCGGCGVLDLNGPEVDCLLCQWGGFVPYWGPRGALIQYLICKK